MRRSQLIALLASIGCAGAIFGFGGMYVPNVRVTCARIAVGAAAQCTLTEQGHFRPMQSTDFLLDGARIERAPTTQRGASGGAWSHLMITTTTLGPLGLPEFDAPAWSDADLRAQLIAFQASPSQLQFEGGYGSRYLSWIGALFTLLGVLAAGLYVARKGGVRETIVPADR